MSGSIERERERKQVIHISQNNIGGVDCESTQEACSEGIYARRYPVVEACGLHNREYEYKV